MISTLLKVYSFQRGHKKSGVGFPTPLLRFPVSLKPAPVVSVAVYIAGRNWQFSSVKRQKPLL